MNDLKVYELSVSGYDEYLPVLFEKIDENSEDFEVLVKKFIKTYVNRDKMTEHWRVEGRDIQQYVKDQLLNAGYRIISPQVVELRGTTPYRESDDKPDIFDKEDWDKIVTYNDRE